MPDNTTLNAVSGTAGDVVRDVQKGGSSGPKTPVAIIDVGGAGAESLLTAGQAAMAASVPVVIASNQSALPVTLGAGSAVVGHVVVDTAPTTAVTGAFWQATQPVSVATLPALAAGTAVIGHVIVDTAPTTTVTGTVAVSNSGFAVVGNVEVTNDVGNPLPVSGTVAATQSGTFTVEPGNTANTTPWLVSVASATTGGDSVYSLISAATTNATNVKNTAGTLTGYAIFNTSSAAKFFKLYDSATAPTAGSGTPVKRLMIPASGGVVVQCRAAFASGIGFTITGASPDNDTTAVALGDVLVNLDYK